MERAGELTWLSGAFLFFGANAKPFTAETQGNAEVVESWCQGPDENTRGIAHCFVGA